MIPLPTLDERREEIPSLAQHFLLRCPTEAGVPGPSRFTDEVIAVLEAAAWPGNVRQLAMVVREAYLQARDSTMIRVSHLPEELALPLQFKVHGKESDNARAVSLALRVTKGQVGHAAKLLGTSRTTIYAYLTAHPEIERKVAKK